MIWKNNVLYFPKRFRRNIFPLNENLDRENIKTRLFHSDLVLHYSVHTQLRSVLSCKFRSHFPCKSRKLGMPNFYQSFKERFTFSL